mmetsp:Transcript_90539/g.260955  ORF Transcript_90539/g.260955 Transcript_90539/m.260955 type:complete len:286 (-) Transcript_90539:895-1752(-)
MHRDEVDVVLGHPRDERHFEGEDGIEMPDVRDFLRMQEEIERPLLRHVQERERHAAARQLEAVVAEHFPKHQGLQVAECLVSADLEEVLHRRCLRVVLRHHCDVNPMRRLGHWQGQVHHRVEFQGLVLRLGKGDLRPDLELKDVDDAGVISLEVAVPSLSCDLQVVLAIRARILHDWPGVRSPVDILMETIEQEREHFLRVVLLVAGELWPLFRDQLLELGWGKHRMRVLPHLGDQVREGVREPTLHAQRRIADLRLEGPGPVVLPQGHCVRQGLQDRVHEASVA